MVSVVELDNTLRDVGNIVLSIDIHEGRILETTLNVIWSSATPPLSAISGIRTATHQLRRPNVDFYFVIRLTASSYTEQWHGRL